MVAAANTKRIHQLSITEHVSQFKEMRETVDFGSVHNKGRIFKDIHEYNGELARIDQAPTGITISRGLEVDYSPRYEARVGDFVNSGEWDILLCSVHEFEDGASIESKAKWAKSQSGANEHWNRYLELERQALESNFVEFQVLSHPVRISRATARVPENIDELLLELAKLAHLRNKALELNGNDIDFAPQLVRKLAKACSKADCRVSLGSDAHYPAQVFRNIPVAMRLVDEFKLELF